MTLSRPPRLCALTAPLLALLVALLGGQPALAQEGHDGSYATRVEARDFARALQAEHGLPEEAVLADLALARRDDEVIRLISPPSRPGVRSWARYRARFIEPVRIRAGMAFWEEHRATLGAAREQYGVPEEIILGILGVETIYGRNTGDFSALSALATLAFDYPPRAELFRRELENLFLLAREQGQPVSAYRGSFAGALGYPQFLPSSIRHFAVDFDGDGRVDLERSPADAIGSIARYLQAHGWQAGAPVAVPARLAGEAPAELLAADITPSFLPEELAAHGVRAAKGDNHPEKAALIELASPRTTPEYWLGYQNFYVITRYNRSSFYAMAVFQLAEALRRRQAGEEPLAAAPGR
jgi:membrane-bound lytic murein transglycosylase B